MTREEQLAFCRVCMYKKMSKEGLLCGFTNQKANFDDSCQHFKINEKEHLRRVKKDHKVNNTEKLNILQRLIKVGAIAIGIYIGGAIMLLLMAKFLIWLFTEFLFNG